jgi:hypothetical protein
MGNTKSKQEVKKVKEVKEVKEVKLPACVDPETYSRGIELYNDRREEQRVTYQAQRRSEVEAIVRARLEPAIRVTPVILDWVITQVRASINDTADATHEICNRLVVIRFRKVNERAKEARDAMCAIEPEFEAAQAELGHIGIRKHALEESILAHQVMIEEHIPGYYKKRAELQIEVAAFRRELSELDMRPMQQTVQRARETVRTHIEAVDKRNRIAALTRNEHFMVKHKPAADITALQHVPVTMFSLLPEKVAPIVIDLPCIRDSTELRNLMNTVQGGPRVYAVEDIEPSAPDAPDGPPAYDAPPPYEN